MARRNSNIDTCSTVLIILWAILLAGYAIDAAGSPASELSAASAVRVDPNEAPWWELTALPRIGPTLAKRIVRHREEFTAIDPVDMQRPVFASPYDLQHVRGIGPKTVERISPYLVFSVSGD